MVVFLKNKAVKKILIRKNMSQNWLAAQLGISSGYISQLMCGVRHPSPALRQKFLDSLSCEFSDLFLIRNTDK